MWNRRRFLTTALSSSALALPAFAADPPRVALSFDDFHWRAIPEPYRARANASLLGVLGRRKIQAAAFVVGQYVEEPEGHRIVRQWGDAGHLIGNHTYSHHVLGADDSGLGAFQADILKNEPIVESFPGYDKFFRFPALKEGKTQSLRDGMRHFLKLHGYRNGYVTIDTSDWYYSQRLAERLVNEPAFDVNRYRAPYLAHIADRAAYYERMGRAVLGRSIPHTLLLHYNLLNVLFLEDVIAQFDKLGWRVIDFNTAVADPIYKREPNIVPAGESLVWALAKETGQLESQLRYPGEDSDYEQAALDKLGL